MLNRYSLSMRPNQWVRGLVQSSHLSTPCDLVYGPKASALPSSFSTGHTCLLVFFLSKLCKKDMKFSSSIAKLCHHTCRRNQHRMQKCDLISSHKINMMAVLWRSCSAQEHYFHERTENKSHSCNQLISPTATGCKDDDDCPQGFHCNQWTHECEAESKWINHIPLYILGCTCELAMNIHLMATILRLQIHL